jgi:hypothetical protein
MINTQKEWIGLAGGDIEYVLDAGNMVIWRIDNPDDKVSIYNVKIEGLYEKLVKACKMLKEAALDKEVGWVEE